MCVCVTSQIVAGPVALLVLVEAVDFIPLGAVWAAACVGVVRCRRHSSPIAAPLPVDARHLVPAREHC